MCCGGPRVWWFHTIGERCIEIRAEIIRYWDVKIGIFYFSAFYVVAILKRMKLNTEISIWHLMINTLEVSAPLPHRYVKPPTNGGECPHPLKLSHVASMNKTNSPLTSQIISGEYPPPPPPPDPIDRRHPSIDAFLILVISQPGFRRNRTKLHQLMCRQATVITG